MAENTRKTDILDKVISIIGEEGYRNAFAPIEDASGLPNAAYWSDEWLKLEQHHCFQDSWVFAGAEAEIPHKGDIKPIEIGGAPIMLVRDQEERIHAFHNVCRHRGARLITQDCHKTTITCPYHAWTYALDGKLRTRPHFFGPDKIDKLPDGGGSDLNLISVRVACWNGCIFVNISGKAEPLEDWLAPMLARCQNYDFTSIKWAGKLAFEVNANWKLVYENYMEGYHVFAVHPKLLKFAPMNIRWSGEWDQHVFYNDYLFPKTSEGRGEDLPHYPNLPDDDAKRGLWFLCFPHFAAEVYPDQFTVLVSYPVAPHKTIEEIHVFLINEAATSDKFKEPRDALFKMWEDLNHEDIGMLERLQQGRLSPAYDGGRLSPHWEGPTHQFGARIIEKIVT